MSRELFVRRWEMEQPAFLRVLRALPGDHLDYRPHQRSQPAGTLAWQLAEEHRLLCDLFDSGEINWSLLPNPAKLDAIVSAYEKNTDELRRRLHAADDAKWDSPGKFIAGGAVLVDARIQDVCWSFLFDAVHHRGQLSAYIRPMGGKVPAIYGASGDAAPGQ